MRVARFLGILLLSLTAAGCLSSPSGTGARFERMTYHLSGGVAGFDQQIRITADGDYELTERGRLVGESTLPAAEMQDLREKVGRVKWGELAPRYIDPRLADALVEDLTVRLNGDDYHVRVSTGGGAPAELDELLSTLRQLWIRHKKGKGMTPHSHSNGGSFAYEPSVFSFLSAGLPSGRKYHYRCRS